MEEARANSLIKKAIIFAGIGSIALFPAPAHADVDVRGYYRNGTYVRAHKRSDPNGTKLDNWTQKGNVNSYTGNY